MNTASGGLLDGEVARLFPDADEMAAAVRHSTPFGRPGEEGELADVVRRVL